MRGSAAAAILFEEARAALEEDRARELVLGIPRTHLNAILTRS